MMILVNLTTEIPSFGCGYRRITALRIGRKFVRVQRTGKKRARIIPRHVWNSLLSHATVLAEEEG